jgi:hypothetical protein
MAAKKKRPPPEKKRLSLERDRRNDTGRNDKASRKLLPRRRAEKSRKFRRVSRQVLGGDAEGAKIEAVRREVWKKEPGVALGKHVKELKTRRAKMVGVKRDQDAVMRTRERASGNLASRLIDARIRELGAEAEGWRGSTLARMRALVLDSDPEIIEEWKWKVPVWSHPRYGIICTGETYKKVVKLTFAKGAKVPDPKGLFNSSLTGNTRRAIDIREGEKVDAAAFKALVKAAVAVSGGAKAEKKPRPARTPKSDRVVLLSGGNPQIAKGEGDAPVQAYIAAMSGGGDGWKRDFGRQLDALIERTVPGVKKAVKWNSPFYGVEGQGWFLSTHVLTRYVKVTFFQGLSLKPIPPGGTEKSKEARWVDVYEGEFDEGQMEKWVKQAAAIPGWVI